MKKEKLILLILALILSSILRLRFSLYNGLEFHGFWLTPPITFFSFSTKFTHFLTTTFLGYLLFAVYGIIEYKMTLKGSKQYQWLTIFIIFCVASASYEIAQMISDYNGRFNGRHFHCGPLLFLIGIAISEIGKKAQYYFNRKTE